MLHHFPQLSASTYKFNNTIEFIVKILVALLASKQILYFHADVSYLKFMMSNVKPF